MNNPNYQPQTNRGMISANPRPLTPNQRSNVMRNMDDDDKFLRDGVSINKGHSQSPISRSPARK